MPQTRLKQLREEAVLTVHELAEASGVSDDTISKIENGQRIARPSTLRKLAQALVVSPQELRKLAVEEAALAGKAEASETGPTNREVPIYDFVHKAALLQAQRDVQAMNRLSESGHQDMPGDMSPDNDTLHYLLNQPAGEVENAYIELMRDHVQLEHENTQLREELSSAREQERTHS
jgi:transcriptional regulator with XRE-family HTH domain